jgi:hypothetical protein
MNYKYENYFLYLNKNSRIVIAPITNGYCKIDEESFIVGLVWQSKRAIWHGAVDYLNELERYCLATPFYDLKFLHYSQYEAPREILIDPSFFMFMNNVDSVPASDTSLITMSASEDPNQVYLTFWMDTRAEMNNGVMRVYTRGHTTFDPTATITSGLAGSGYPEKINENVGYTVDYYRMTTVVYWNGWRVDYKALVGWTDALKAYNKYHFRLSKTTKDFVMVAGTDPLTFVKVETGVNQIQIRATDTVLAVEVFTIDMHYGVVYG